MTTVTGAEFNRQPSRVKLAAAHEPVVITEHNRPSFVLMTYAEFERLRQAPGNLADWLEMDVDVEFEPEPHGVEIRPADL